jgi:hypothetical protein
MKKKIIIPLVISLLLIVAYTVFWCLLIVMPARELNKYYAGRDINTRVISGRESYYIKFTKVVPYGFPFKLGFKIIGWTEESKVGKIEALSPLHIGYDLIAQKLYGHYAGETLAWHKPLQSKFGSNIKTENYELAIKIPFFKVLNIMLSKEVDKFEIVNFIETLELNSGKEQVFDSVGHEKLYDQDFKNLKLTFKKRKYYTSVKDFLENQPSQIDIEQSAKINETILFKRAMPPTILFGLNLPFFISGSNKITFKINEPHIENFIKDLEIYYKAIDSVSDIHQAQAEIVYKGKINNKDADISFKINSELDVKTGFFDKIFQSLKYITNFVELNNRDDFLKEGSPFKWLTHNLIERLNNPVIRELEGHKYLLNVDVNLKNKSRELSIAVNDFNIFSGKTGMALRGENKVDQNMSWSIGGRLGFNNQPRITELLIKKDVFGLLPNFSNDAKDLYATVSDQFVKSLSDSPLSKSDDITLEYSFGSKQLKKGKIGKINVENLSVLFDLALYKEAVKKIGSTGHTPNMLQELAPTLTFEKQAALEKIIVNPTTVEQDTWNELIK